MKRLSFLFVALLAWGSLKAATTPSSDLGGVFDSVDVGSRPLGLGGAFVAVADDANAAQDNPAGMAFFQDNDHYATFTHSDLFGLSFLEQDYLAYAQGDQGYTAVGVSWNRLSVNLNPGTWAENALEYSGAKQVYGFGPDDAVKLAIGWQVKYLDVVSNLSLDDDGSSVGGGNAQGWGTGLGALLRVGSQWSIGIMDEDLYSSLTWASGDVEVIPMTLREGAAYRYDDQTLVSAEVRQMQGSDVQNPDGLYLSSYHVGAERWLFDGKSSPFGYVKNFGLRAGYYELLQNGDSGTLTVGASVKADSWELNYNYEFNLGADTLGDTQRFGLDLKF